MKMIYRVRIACSALLCSLLLAGCMTATTSEQHTGRVRHVVVCWLKEPGNRQARQQIVEASNALAAIPGVLEVAAGTAIPSERKIVDSSFDVAVVITLKDAAALKAYLDHPAHRKAQEEVLQPLVARVVVYDIIE